MIVFEDEQGLCFWPMELVASVTPAVPDRFRVVTTDGTVGYSLVGEIQCREGVDPAGFTHESSSGELPLEYIREPFWAVENRAVGLVRHGDGDSSPAVAEDLQGLVQCGPNWFFQPRRLRRVGPGLVLTFDGGQTLKVDSKWSSHVLQALGVSSLQLFPEALTRTFLREYPFEIARASAEVLRQHFTSARQLVANLLWQALEYVRLGLDKGYGTSHRGFWYNPLYATLERAGLVDLRLTKDGAETLYWNVLAEMIERDRLFCYRELGFVDAHASQREIGALRPEVIVLIEKDSLAASGIAAARHFGLSWIVMGGVSRLVAVEFFRDALREVYAGEVMVLVDGDYDPGGWLAGHTFVQHLGRYAVDCPRGPQFLICPEVFTAEELELFSRPLSAKDGRVDEWVAESGGIGGEARGIHADWLHPAERVQQAVQKWLERA